MGTSKPANFQYVGLRIVYKISLLLLLRMPNSHPLKKKVKPFSILSSIEFEILCHIKNGNSSFQIAELRNCSSRTIEKHRSNIIKKLKITSSQNALVIWIFQNPDFFNT